MPVIQINVWICEVCGYIATETSHTFPYADPVVEPPNDIEWEYIGADEKLACPACVVKHESQKS